MSGKKVTVMMMAIMMLMTSISYASTAEKTDAPIKYVTVFPDRAQITRTADLNLSAGKHTILIENLPIILDAGSFRTSAAGIDGITLLGLDYGIESHLEDPNEKAAEIERRIKKLENDDRQSINDRMESFVFQKDFLISIKEESGRDIADQLQTLDLDVTQWKEAYLFVGKALREVSDSIRLASAELEDVENLIRFLREEMNMTHVAQQRQSYSVEIGLMLEKAGPVSVDLRYMIGNAAWKPLYDARLHDKDDNVELSYFAEVVQCTGEDWNDVDLTLSTAMPSFGAGPGEFKSWLLSISEPPVIRGGRAGEVSYIIGETSIGDPLGGYGLLDLGLTLKSKRLKAEIARNHLNTTFHIKTPETVLSGEKAVKTHISTFELKSTMGTISRPKNTETAFRLVSIINQDEAPLMPGQVSIFAGTDYLGKANIRDLIVPGRQFKLPFGKDNNIEIEREIIEEKKSDKDDKWRIEKTIKITLTNNGKKARQVTVEEAFPVSQDNRIKVKMQDVLPESYSIDEKGKAVWIVGLNPGKKKEIMIPYRIEYPKDARVSGL